jgi:hypothetical protein
VISPSQGLYLHRSTEHRKTRPNIHVLSEIRTCDPVYERSRTAPQTARPLDRRFLSLRSKYSPQYPVLKHRQCFTHLLLCAWLSLTQVMASVHSTVLYVSRRRSVADKYHRQGVLSSGAEELVMRPFSFLRNDSFALLNVELNDRQRRKK